ncbi:WD repeat-containing protein 46-like [Uloborus diversus]|uniref:WD repeat-containing protein 46-like n=1 Tax=Uloborus diversus TaxID=327109 RepID=UPI00240A8189|nr:WD repeat-containing protein 46-like [Uloborus diversus]
MSRYYSITESKKSGEVEKEIKRKEEKKEKSKHKKAKFKEETEKTFYEEDDFDPYEGPVTVPNEVLKKYQRGKRLDVRHLRSKSHKAGLIQADKKIRQSVQLAARSELLLQEEAGFLEPDENEDTYRVKQEEIAAAADITSATKYFDLSLTEFGPYKINYSRDGRHLLLGGYRGHVAAMDWVTKRLLCEINVMESVHDLCWLHLPTMFATAQKDWVYVYDSKGVELHCIKRLSRVLQLEFLPYHFLLVTSSEKGFLAWLDVSIGKMVKETYTKAGRLNIMCQNPYNAVVATGHPNGSVSMWSPNVEKPLARMLCHPHPIRSIAIDNKGLYMATSCVDRTMKIFDVRTLKCLQSYKLGAAAGFLDFSQQGLLSAGLGNVVEVYKDCCTQAVKSPYIRHKITSTVSDIQFCPYEDVLGIGYSSGFSSILIPGAGQANFDAYESNPFMTKSQRREMEVKSLLEKIQPELITLNPGQLGSIDIPTLKDKLEKKKSLPHVKPPKVEFEPRPKAKGRSKSARVFKRKKIVQETAKRNFIKSAVKEKPVEKEKSKPSQGVLDRFKSKTK